MQIKRIFKFGITGGIGTITNLVLFFIFVDILKLNHNIVNVCCFFVACTQNYIINHLWTFKHENNDTKLSFKLWSKFVIVSLLGLAVNLLVMNFLLHLCGWKYLVVPQCVGIMAGMLLNYLMSNLIVFRRNTNDE